VPYQVQLDRQVQRLYLEDLRLLTELSPNLAMLRLFFLPEEEVGVAARAPTVGSANNLEQSADGSGVSARIGFSRSYTSK
jgi:hypothetical protein